MFCAIPDSRRNAGPVQFERADFVERGLFGSAARFLRPAHRQLRNRLLGRRRRNVIEFRGDLSGHGNGGGLQGRRGQHAQPAGVALIGGATAGAYALQVGAIYNSTPPTFTTGQGGSLQMTATGQLITASTQKNACGATFYEATMQFLPATSTSLTTTATCITSAWFNNTDTATHQVTLQDQSTACNAGVCEALATFSIPANSFLRVQLDGSKFVGGIKWTADTANKVAADIIGNQ